MTTIIPSPTDDDPYELFLEALRTSATRKTYCYALSKFLEYSKVDDYDNLIEGELQQIEDRVLGYIRYLNSQDNISNSSRNIRIFAVKLFYKMNGKRLDWDRLLALKKNDKPAHKDRAYSREEITKMLEITGRDDNRLRAIILIYATSGIRLSALATLKIGDLKYMESDKLMALKVYAGEREQYDTFITLQATKHLLRYFKERFKRLDNLPVDQPVIGHEYYPQLPLSAETIGQAIGDLAEKVGIRPEGDRPTERKEIMRVHGFRKFYNTVLAMTPNLSTLITEMLLGHDVGLNNNYMRPTLDQLLAEYRKAIPALTFNFDNPIAAEPRQAVQ